MPQSPYRTRRGIRTANVNTTEANAGPRTRSVRRLRRRLERRARMALAIPRGVFPAMDQAVVTAEWALPDDVTRRDVQFSNDIGEASASARVASST